MFNKIAIVGKGTAGSQAISHFLKWMPNIEIDWYYDPTIPTQAVGEGSVITFPINLSQNLSFTWDELEKINGTIKTGVYKSGWGNMPDFLHGFNPPNVTMHFNARGMQDYIYDKVKDKVNLIEGNVDSSNIDADFIMDCSGKPDSLEDFNIPSYIPVNSVHVNQCYWDYPRFNHTLTIARPYGWVFGIPLTNRCSVGYLYNSKINTLEEVKEDIKNIFEKYNLEPSEDTNSFTFGNYYRKNNYVDNICYNGNASFFLEPIEATSVYVMDNIQRNTFEVWNGLKTNKKANEDFLRVIKEIETMIMLHYLAGSKWDTEFWRFAKDRGEKALYEAKNDDKFKEMIEYVLQFKNINDIPPMNMMNYSVWSAWSFHQNLDCLGIKDKVKETLNI